MSRYRRSAAALVSGSPTGSSGGSGASTTSKRRRARLDGRRHVVGPEHRARGSSSGRPKGIHPSPSSRARRSDRRGPTPHPDGHVAPGRRWARPRSPSTRSACPAYLGSALARTTPGWHASASSARGPAPGERHAEELELGLERSHADTEDDPAPAGDVEGAVALDHLEGMVVAEHEHVGEQPDGGSRRRRSSVWRAGPSTARPGWPRWASGMTTCSGHDTHSYPRRSAPRATSTMSSIPPCHLPLRGIEAGIQVHHRGHDAQTHACPPPPSRGLVVSARRPSWRVPRPASRAEHPLERLPCRGGTRRTQGDPMAKYLLNVTYTHQGLQGVVGQRRHSPGEGGPSGGAKPGRLARLFLLRLRRQ